ncbi:hypothetical protein AAHE18_12G016300 [Arachis hypogaea]
MWKMTAFLLLVFHSRSNPELQNSHGNCCLILNVSPETQIKKHFKTQVFVITKATHTYCSTFSLFLFIFVLFLVMQLCENLMNTTLDHWFDF